MKKQNIVKKSEDFNKIIKKRQGKASKYFIINQEKNTDITKFGITFTKHIGNAVTRNKLKRRIKNIIDINPKMYNKQTTYIIIAKKTTLDLTYQELEKELIYLFNKLKGEKNEEKEENIKNPISSLISNNSNRMYSNIKR